MYTVNVTSKTIQRQSGRIVIDVNISNGTSSHTKSFSFALTEGIDRVKSQIKNYIDSLEAAEAEIESLVVGPLDLTSIPSQQLTQEKLDKRLWLERDSLWERVQIAIEKGYLTGTEPKVIALNSWLKNNFKPEYIDLV